TAGRKCRGAAMNIVLIGFKNCGKTATSSLLAEKLNRRFVDTDQLIEQHYLVNTQLQRSTREIFLAEGEIFFRDLGKTAIASLTHLTHSVIASGGGSVLEQTNLHELARSGRLIYLYADCNTLFQRLQSQPCPAFLDPHNQQASFSEHYRRRHPIYARAAHHQI